LVTQRRACGPVGHTAYYFEYSTVAGPALAEDLGPL